MRVFACLCAFALAASTLTAQIQGKKPAGEAEGSRPLSNFDLNAMDRTADPCVDFYQYSCGGWMKQNPIPADESRWGRFSELAERNRAILRQILEDAGPAKPNRTALEQKYGDFYAACMDENAANRKADGPIQPLLRQVDELSAKDQLAALLVTLHRQSAVGAMFRFSSDQDYKDASQVIAEIGQGGLGLPDRDYYTKTDPKSVEIRKQYLDHVAKIFGLLGDSPERAAAEANVVMQIETALAEASQTRVQRRDPANTYHKLSVAELEKLSPDFSWKQYLADSGAPPIGSLNVESPQFLQELSKEIDTVPLDRWKSYLRWHIAHSMAPWLSDAFVNENFDFYGKTLTGQQELRARWKRCVALTDGQLGEAVGQAYVQETFGPEGKERTLSLVRALETALARDIEDLSWMTPQTKEQAEMKLKAVANKIGYPDKWRDYSSVVVTPGDLVGSLQHTSAFEFRRQLNKIGKPVDKTEWEMTPPTVNAYYDSQMNDINFPAGILQPPFFDKNGDDAENYGGIGVVIGHELTHGFDDQGRKFDAQGNLRDWWTAADATAFNQRADCLADEYGKFSPIPGVNLNGKLTLGENTADNGGLRLAYMALMDTLSKQPEEAQKKVDGFTPEQRYFISFAQVWCENRTPESERQLATVDPHSPGKFRVLGTVQNDEDFGKAFGCRLGQPMRPVNACRVW